MEWDELIRSAREARMYAYAPYSHYPVGAAILDERGEIHSGCNVENVSFGATLCAERVALGKMVSTGGKIVRRLVVATADGGTPCGICLQCLLEFKDRFGATEVLVLSDDDQRLVTLDALMPQPFASFLPS